MKIFLKITIRKWIIQDISNIVMMTSQNILSNDNSKTINAFRLKLAEAERSSVNMAEMDKILFFNQ
jgi:hypothetical protein